ncbi:MULTISPECIES: ABC transporter permease subunit [Bacillus]|nr:MULTISPECIES: ABC transporter permease subunit [Bacillus]MDH4420671.1 ABC transporter permease subunit [Bacillus cereus]
MESLVSAMKEPYVYSLSILWGGFIVSFCIAMVFAYLCFNLPKRVQKVIKGVAFFIESIPDVVFIFSIQLFVIWVFQKTDLLVVKPLAGFDNVYMLPIFTIAILPSVMLFQMMILAFQNEETKTYVEYAKAKGLSRKDILFRHIFRNALVTVFSNMQYLFWFMLSNLLVAEYLFNMRGFFSFLYKHKFETEVLAIGLIAVFIPFYIVDIVGKWFITYLTGEGE